MRDPARIERILTRLRAYWLSAPDLRLTQIVGNAVGRPGDHYYVEDDIVEAGIPVATPPPEAGVLTVAQCLMDERVRAGTHHIKTRWWRAKVAGPAFYTLKPDERRWQSDWLSLGELYESATIVPAESKEQS